MAVIDYGALLKVNGEFINKNCNLFMNNSNTGYILEKAKYADTSIYDKEININGNFYVYAGDKDLLLTFCKWYLYVISNEKIIKVISDNPFISEEFYINGVSIKVSHLEPDIQIEVPNIVTWEDYIKENWIDATGCEKLDELKNGMREYKSFLRRVKASRRRVYKYRTNRWITEWEHNGNKYEVIFGDGIDPNAEVWNRIKKDSYGFTEREINIINEWFL